MLLRTVIAMVAFFAISAAAATDDLLEIAKRFFQPLPNAMPGSAGDTASMIALGRALYFERVLSANRQQSCNSCHNLLNEGAGTDGLATSPGTLGVAGIRNSPTTWNAGFQFAQFWDGRVATLEEQARSPLMNPNEMALASEAQAMDRLAQAGYRPLFAEAFAGHAEPFAFENLLVALAAFQRTLISEDRFDDYLRGARDALSEQEKRGLKQFIWTGCNGCHHGPLLGGDSIMKLGIAHRYPNQEDTGRAQVTGNAADNFFFKVPPLRNVGLTGPYFHDGAGSSLERAVFDTAFHQLGITMSDQEVADIAAFLRTLDNRRPFQMPDPL